MSIGVWIGNNRYLLLAIAVLALIAAIFYNLRGMAHGRPTREALRAGVPEMYYDLNTGATFVGGSSEVLPVKAPSDSGSDIANFHGVHAYMFSCGSCTDKASWFVGYLENLNDEARSIKLTGHDPNHYFGRRLERYTKGFLVANPDAKPLKWVPKDSDDGADVLAGPAAKCHGDQTPDECRPSF